MDTLEAIYTRRSIRKYTDEPVTADEEETLLRAAMTAPNTVNKRDWAFVTIRDRDRLSALSACLNNDGHMLPDAQLAIVICGDLDLTLRGIEDYWIEDTSAAATTLLLCAHHLGLGAVWLGCYPQYDKVSKVSKLLDLPRSIVPMCVISIGHPAEQKPDVSEQRFEPQKIHREKW